MKKFLGNSNAFIYLDPPYYVKGSSLYLNSYQDAHHRALANFLNANANENWLLTYDNVPEIVSLYTERTKAEFNLSYHINLPKVGKEVLILSDRLKKASLLSTLDTSS